MNPNPDNVLRLPLWRECAKEMLATGIRHGQTYPASFFEERLKTDKLSMPYSLGIAEIRRLLEQKGYYLSGRGQHGTQFIILPPSSNADVMLGYGRKAADALKRGVILGTNTRLDLLNAEDRRRHEAVLERMAIKAVLISRSTQIANALPASAKHLLAS